MKDKIKHIIKSSQAAKSALLEDEQLIGQIQKSAELIIQALKAGGKVLTFGNGGSAADSQHFAAELVGRFQAERRALAAVALCSDVPILSSLSNDYSFDIVFKRQIEALAKPQDLAFSITTSGRSKNVIEGLKQAKKMGLKSICLTGKDGGAAKEAAEISIIAPASVTARIQELHILIIHIICEIVEEAFKK